MNDIIYLFTRLFSPEDRSLSVLVEKYLIEALANYGIRDPNIFVPYRDTKQETVTVKNKAKYIYEADVQRLKQSQVLIGLLNGMSKDEGIGFEIGYALAEGIPTFAGVSDFFQYEIPHTGVTFPVDPVLLAALTGVVHLPLIEQQQTYQITQELHVKTLISTLVRLWMTSEKPNPPARSTKKQSRTRVHLELMGGLYEWNRLIGTTLEQQLSHVGKVTLSNRWHPSTVTQVGSQKEIKALGLHDLENVHNADVVVVSADSSEMNVGSAVVQGYARGLGKRIVIYDSQIPMLCANGGHLMSRNLMLDQSANIRARSIEEIVNEVLVA